MTKLVVVIMGVVLPLTSKSQELNDIREQYLKASHSSAANKVLAEHIAEMLPNNEPEVHGYLAMSYFLKSKYAFNPFKKYDHFSQGRSIMDSLILEHPENLELRYLRNTIQLKVPKFLNYYDYLDEDYDLILTKLKEATDPQLITMINHFLDEHAEMFADRKKEKN